MVTRTQCQACRASVTATFARVFGNNDDEVHACPSCLTWGDVSNCAATSPAADGTRRVHKPGLEDPEPTVFRDDDEAEPDPRDRLTLAEARKRESEDSVLEGRTEDADEARHPDKAFAAILAK